MSNESKNNTLHGLYALCVLCGWVALVSSVERYNALCGWVALVSSVERYNALANADLTCSSTNLIVVKLPGDQLRAFCATGDERE